MEKMIAKLDRDRMEDAENLRGILKDLKNKNLLPQLREHYRMLFIGDYPSWTWELRNPLEAHPELRSISVIWAFDGNCLEFALRGKDDLVYIDELGMSDVCRPSGASELSQCLINIAKGNHIDGPGENLETE